MDNIKFHPVANLFPLMDGDEYEALKADIEASGLHEPIWIHPEDGSIIDGRNRWRVCYELGIKPTFRTWDGEGDLVAFVLSLNLKRRHLNESQRAMVAAKFANLKHGGYRHGESQEATLPLDPVSNKSAARALCVSERTVKTARKIQENAIPALVEMIDRGQETVSSVARVASLPKEEQERLAEKLANGSAQTCRQARIQVQAEALIAAPLPLPTGPFHVIVADPPWQYNQKGRDNDPTHRGALGYPSMTTEQIKALPVESLACPDAVLLLWTTNAHLPEAFDVACSWGFTYKTLLTWAKNKMGLGDWLRGQTEHCLLCVRGKPTVLTESASTLLTAQVRSHSQKPEEFYALVEKCFPGSKAELFSRCLRPGWVGWGDQTTLFSCGEAA